MVNENAITKLIERTAMTVAGSCVGDFARIDFRRRLFGVSGASDRLNGYNNLVALT